MTIGPTADETLSPPDISISQRPRAGDDNDDDAAPFGSRSRPTTPERAFSANAHTGRAYENYVHKFPFRSLRTKVCEFVLMFSAS